MTEGSFCFKLDDRKDEFIGRMSSEGGLGGAVFLLFSH